MSNAAPPPDGPAAVAPDIATVPLAAAASKAKADRILEIRRDEPFAMAALTWNGAAPDVLEVQAQRLDGSWTEWAQLDPVGGLDAGKAGRTNGSEPVWLDDSTVLRVRAERNGVPANVRTLSAVLIDPGTSTGDAIEPKAGITTTRPPVISRAGWGADESVRTDCYQQQGIGAEYSGTVKAATIHHTGPNTNDYTAADAARVVRGIYAYHAQTLGWCDIGYNVVVDRYGQIFEGRYGGLDLPVWGAHAGGFNKYTTGVSMLGDFTDIAPSDAQLEAVSQFVAWKLSRSYRDPEGTVELVSGGGVSKYPEGTTVTLPTIFAHRDVRATECPGELGYPKLPFIRQRVAELMGDWTSSPVYQRWQDTGADSGRLGGVYGLEREVANGGLRTTFTSGTRSISWSADTGAHIVEGAIRRTWAKYGLEAGHLGYPITDERPTPDGIGRYNHFSGENGSIYYTSSTGAHEIRGSIKRKWAELGWERSPLGYPRTDERPTPDGIGRSNHFSGDNGSIYYTSSTGAHEIRGSIKRKWAELGWERSPLGYPRTDERPTPDGIGRSNHFSGDNGSIYYTSSTGAPEIRGNIKSKWAQLGWERSYLGYPTSDEFSVPVGRRSNFQGGYIVWNSTTGAVTAHRY
ncbi:N-acetylmuramoyl-L-alanine amidase [Qaidamihabitans albus]|uniref:N-acetylmuramoyl-L-alanine amidase n=1 Tax=Qaidamihabitans albus TaxID=2795733 RepID=UPI0027DC4819|nr:N-acetylmuramoyl-L-alanine amidase [Qaidamihabitans albus]